MGDMPHLSQKSEIFDSSSREEPLREGQDPPLHCDLLLGTDCHGRKRPRNDMDFRDFSTCGLFFIFGVDIVYLQMYTCIKSFKGVTKMQAFRMYDLNNLSVNRMPWHHNGLTPAYPFLG